MSGLFDRRVGLAVAAAGLIALVVVLVIVFAGGDEAVTDEVATGTVATDGAVADGAATDAVVADETMTYEGVGRVGRLGAATVVAGDGASIFVPAGAAEVGAEIRAEVVALEDAPPLPDYGAEYLAVWDFDVAGGLDAPVTLRLPAADLEELWVLAHFEDGEWRPASFEIEGGEIVVEAESLSLWGMIKSGISWAADGLVSIGEGALNWVKRQAQWLLRQALDIPSPIRCGDPDPTVSVGLSVSVTDLSAGQRMLSACAERDLPDPLLQVQNDRTFWIQVCSLNSEGRMVGTYPTRLLSDCPDGTVGGLLLSSGHRVGYASSLGQPFRVHASFGTVPQMVTMIDWIVRLIPGLSSVELSAVTELLPDIIGDLQRIPELSQAFNAIAEGEVLRAFGELADAILGGDTIGKIETILINSGLWEKLGVNFGKGVLKEILIIADVAAVITGITDIWATQLSGSGFRGLATFTSVQRIAAAAERDRQQAEEADEREPEPEAVQQAEQAEEEEQAEPVIREVNDSVETYAWIFCDPFTRLVGMVFVDPEDNDELRRDATWGGIRRLLREILGLAPRIKPPPSMERLHATATAAIEAAIAYSERYDDDDLFVETYDFADLLRDPRFLLTMLPLGDAIFAISESDADLLATGCPALEFFDETTLGLELDDGELGIREQGFWSLGAQDPPPSRDGDEMSE